MLITGTDNAKLNFRSLFSRLYSLLSRLQSCLCYSVASVCCLSVRNVLWL